MKRARSHFLLPALVTGLILAAPAPGHATTDAADYGYGFYRTVEGRVLLTGLDEDAEPLEVEPNYPLLTGDRVWVETNGRLEAVLPDRSRLRFEAGTEIYFESLAGSSDSPEGAQTIVRLFEGEMQLEGDPVGGTREQILIDTANAQVYVDLAGTYRVTTDGEEWTEVVVRGGFAEVTTERGSVVARDGDRVLVEGRRAPDVVVLAAGGLDDLERWGEALSGRGRLARNEYLDDSLAYAAAPLEEAGAWVSVSGRYAWRPTVRAGWRPYYDGWWATTPSGLSWVAYEPWGWVTSHYGAWDYVPGWGWLWFPGSVYSPAWVYWYWGPTHVAWIPSGYYTRYYGPRFGFSFNFGVYGWAGGYWDSWSYWTFCPTRYFGRRSYRPYWRSGHDMARDRRLHAVPRGIVTTDTRGISRGHFGKPNEIYSVLEKRYAGRAGTTRSMPDVSDFVGRRSTLQKTTEAAVRSDRKGLSTVHGPAGRSTITATRRSEAAPWSIDRPEKTNRSAGVAQRGSSVSRDDPQRKQWELIERLRRYENKQESLPRSPRQAAPSSSASPYSRFGSSGETPARKILDSVRSQGSSPRSSSVRRPTTPPPSNRPSVSSPRSGSSSSRGSVKSPPPSSRRPSSSAKPSSGSSKTSGSSKSSGSRSRVRRPN